MVFVSQSDVQLWGEKTTRNHFQTAWSLVSAEPFLIPSLDMYLYTMLNREIDDFAATHCSLPHNWEVLNSVIS